MGLGKREHESPAWTLVANVVCIPFLQLVEAPSPRTVCKQRAIRARRKHLSFRTAEGRRGIPCPSARNWDSSPSSPHVERGIVQCESPAPAPFEMTGECATGTWCRGRTSLPGYRHRPITGGREAMATMLAEAQPNKTDATIGKGFFQRRALFNAAGVTTAT